MMDGCAPTLIRIAAPTGQNIMTGARNGRIEMRLIDADGLKENGISTRQ